MSTLAERIEKAINESGHTPSSLARAVGCTPAAVLQWISGATKNIKNELLFAVADATKFEARWLATGKGEERGLAELNHRVIDLVHNYARCDERGKETVLIVAEREASYNKEN